MDVIKNNFQKALDELDDDLQQASFVAIDTEFTGLKNGKTRFSSLDTPTERYAKILDISLQFLVIQFGLSIFQYDEHNLKYVNKTYNFYIFPNGNTATLPGLCDPTFLCQASSLGFLASQGFDFNKLINEGIPFLNLANEEKVKGILEKKNYKCSETTGRKLTGISPDEEEFVNNTVLKIKQFLAENHRGGKTELILECSTLQQDLIYTHVKLKFSDALVFESSKKVLKNCTVTIKRTDSIIPKKGLLENDWSSEVDNQIQEYLGFSRVIKKITSSGKLVVGHNMLLDLCHILNQFCGPLPKDYEEFKVMANTFFPRILDTKVMATTQPFRELLPNSALEPLAQSLQKSPFKKIEIAPAANFPSYSLDIKKNHEAGYDAFLTGLCFITMANHLEDTGACHPKTIGHKSKLITPFFQKIFMMMSFDIPYMTITGPDLEPPRDHVFHVTFPKDWKLQDLFQLFKNYGPVRVDWTGDTSAFVTLHRKEKKLTVLEETKIPVGCTITSYESHFKNLKIIQSKEVDIVAARKRRCSADPDTNSSLFKKVRQESSDNQKMSKTEFEVSDDWE